MSKNFDHTNCTHASSKAGRAKCRRDRDKMADAFASILDSANVQTEGVEIVVPESSPVFEPVRVTAENWRDFKETPVKIAMLVDLDTESVIAEGAYITGWGKSWINYTDADGKSRRCSSDTKRVTTLGEA